MRSKDPNREEKTLISVYLNKKDADQIKEIAKKHQLAVSSWIRALIREYLEKITKK